LRFCGFGGVGSSTFGGGEGSLLLTKTITTFALITKNAQRKNSKTVKNKPNKKEEKTFIMHLKKRLA
jgi:hypothetical protein